MLREIAEHAIALSAAASPLDCGNWSLTCRQSGAPTRSVTHRRVLLCRIIEAEGVGHFIVGVEFCVTSPLRHRL